MKAHVLYAVGDLRWTEVAEPTLRSDEVLVRVRAAGICGSDVARVFKTGTYHFPTIIGHEFSGEVCRVYEPATQSHLLGKRVGVFPLKPCFRCENCRQGVYECCTDYDYLGSRCDGGFAEYVAVPEWNLLELPETIDFPTAAMLEPASVAMHALRQSGFRTGDTVAVVGPGTIGMILCRLAQLEGAKKTILIGRSPCKLDFARTRYGIEYVINSTTENVQQWISDITEGRGVDVIFEGTGASASMEMCLNLVRYSGHIVALGNPLGDMTLEKGTYWKLLRRQLHLHGTWNSRFGTPESDWTRIVALLEQGALSLSPLITHRLPFDRLLEGFNIMRDDTVYSNKIMLVNE